MTADKKIVILQNMIKTLEGYYLSKPEPYQSCLLALRDIVLNTRRDICTNVSFKSRSLPTKARSWHTYG
ncbi:hypothetical protein [Mucilaginibacter panaciglaebae]|uniref:hypothetical protein n=1 Tax=Mucilaginibacter panaciglaebae TaxID=502331 RepID=UPI0031E8C5E8